MNAIHPLPHPPATDQRNWTRSVDGDGIVWLSLDSVGRGTNILSDPVIGELDELIGELEALPPRGLVITSGRPAVFIAGADVEAFARLRRPEEALALVDRVHDLLARLEALPCPVVAAIDGACLGGGLELALACHYRVASDAPATRLGLPEVKLGIQPGFGGTLRLPRLIGPAAALPLMLSGRTLDARRAGRLGLVDRVVPARHLRRAAHQLVCSMPAAHRPALAQRLALHRPLRDLLVRQARRQLARRVDPQHYPAPYALLDQWHAFAGDPEALLRAEAHSVAELLLTPTSRNLVRLFGLRDRLKRLGRRHEASVRHVHVVGAGVMGAEIAAWCALRGLTVTVEDQRFEALGGLLPRAAKLFSHELHQPRAEQAALDRLIPDPKGSGLRRADLVIEAIVEKLEAKRALFRRLESAVRPDTLLATNTSAIPLEAIAAGLQRPGRLVGIHFFNPVAKMPLVEVVSGESTDTAAAGRAAAFVAAIGRLPLPVVSRPGFLVNRILMPYLLEAVTLFEEGIAPEAVDAAACDFGMPMGPLALADSVGLDICLAVARELGGTVPESLARLVTAGHLGRKSGRGFHRYDGRGRRRTRRPWAPPDTADRLILRLLNEAAACLREGIVADADLLDAGVVFGTGFAPFRGGPLTHARALGAVALREGLETLATRHGQRFRPDPGWAQILER